MRLLKADGTRQKPKVLAAGVGPACASGYGTVWRHVLAGLSRYGWSVPLFDMTSQADMRHVLRLNDIDYDIIPGGREKGRYSLQDYHAAAMAFDINVLLYDIWGFNPATWQQLPGWVPYVPVDAPLSEFAAEIYRVQLRSARHIVAMSEFGAAELRRANVQRPITVIPHGVETNVFVPLEDEEKSSARLEFGLPAGAFIVGFVGRNVGDRKQIPRLIEIFLDWIEGENIRNAWLYLHTDPALVPGGGVGIPMLTAGAGGRVVTPDPGQRALSEPDMARLLGCFDVYATCSAAEGCGLPILEAQSCAVPCIVPRNSAQPEWLPTDAGFVIECSDDYVPLTTGLHCRWGLADRKEFRNALGTYYNDESLKKVHGEKARRRMVEGFYWSNIVKEKWIPLLESL